MFSVAGIGGNMALPVSIVVPVLNEEAAIEELLENLAALGAAEIWIVDGGSTDRTAERVRPPARLLVTEPGRARQMNEGARRASGEILLFLHADIRLRAGALTALRAALADPRVPGGNFRIHYSGGDFVARFFDFVNYQRCRFGIFYGDSGIFCRREVYDTLGGFRPWPILEDYDFARRLWRAGEVAFLEEPIYVSDRRWRNAGLLATLWSWFCIQGLYLAGVHPDRLARMYRAVR
jgi:rSAM/selenodomain-associated transferase 2